MPNVQDVDSSHITHVNAAKLTKNRHMHELSKSLEQSLEENGRTKSNRDERSGSEVGSANRMEETGGIKKKRERA
eukprot:208276-Pleurochrysis_carterae.AAC.20